MRQILVVLLLFMSSVVWADQVETVAGGLNIVVGADQFANDLGSGAFYNPGVILSPDGTELWLYVQGTVFGGGPVGAGQEPCPDTSVDKVFFMKAPYTSTGVKGRFEFVRRITPCDASYGPGQPFWVGPLRMVFDRSDQTTFSELVLGETSDGANWSFQTFITATGTSVEILAPALIPDDFHSVFAGGSCTGAYGYMPFNTDTTSGTTAIKVQFCTTYARGFRVWIFSGGGWKQVDDLTGEFAFTPDNLWPGVFVESIFRDGSIEEAWGYRNVQASCSPCSFSIEGGTTFSYREISSFPAFGPEQQVFSWIRCMPSQGWTARLYPALVWGPSGEKLMYSSTNDENICTSTSPDPFVGIYTVVTEVQ